MLRKNIIALATAIAMGSFISASAFAASGGFGGGSSGHNGGLGDGHGSGFRGSGLGFRGFPGRSLIGGRPRPWYGIGIYPYPSIETSLYLDGDDYEPICGFVWMDRSFGYRVVRQRVYACSGR
jgi:hypothetical protein